MSEWQPIETAPKGRGNILVYGVPKNTSGVGGFPIGAWTAYWDFIDEAIADARRQFIERVDGKEIAALRAENKRLLEVITKIAKTTTWSDAMDLADAALARPVSCGVK